MFGDAYTKSCGCDRGLCVCEGNDDFNVPSNILAETIRLTVERIESSRDYHKKQSELYHKKYLEILSLMSEEVDSRVERELKLERQSIINSNKYCKKLNRQLDRIVKSNSNTKKHLKKILSIYCELDTENLIDYIKTNL